MISGFKHNTVDNCNVKNLFYFLGFISAIIFGCNQAEQAGHSTGIVMKLSDDSASVELHQIDQDVLTTFLSDTIDSTQWHNFFAVYEEPADEALRDVQKPLTGTYTIKDSVIRFTPAMPFKKGQAYFAHCYAKRYFFEAVDMVKSRKMPSRTEPLEIKFVLY